MQFELQSVKLTILNFHPLEVVRASATHNFKWVKITHMCSIWGRKFRPLGYERVYLPLCKVADTPFHIQGDDLKIIIAKHIYRSNNSDLPC